MMNETPKGHIPGMEAIRAIREHQDKQCAGLGRKQRERAGDLSPCTLCPWCDKQYILDDAIELAGYVHDLIAIAQGRTVRTVRQETMLEKARQYFDNAAIQGHHDAVIDAQRS